MKAGQMNDTNGESASNFRSHDIEEIDEIIRVQLLQSSCNACTKLQDDGFNIKHNRVTVIEGNQYHMVHCVYKCTFQVQWSVQEFWIDQCKSEEPTSLEAIIVLTGRAVDAQATTVGEYMRSHWPESSTMLLDVLQRFLEDSPSALRGMLTYPKIEHS